MGLLVNKTQVGSACVDVNVWNGWLATAWMRWTCWWTRRSGLVGLYLVSAMGGGELAGKADLLVGHKARSLLKGQGGGWKEPAAPFTRLPPNPAPIHHTELHNLFEWPGRKGSCLSLPLFVKQ